MRDLHKMPVAVGPVSTGLKGPAAKQQQFKDQEHEKVKSISKTFIGREVWRGTDKREVLLQLLQSVWDLKFKEVSKLLGKSHIKYSEPLRKVSCPKTTSSLACNQLPHRGFSIFCWEAYLDTISRSMNQDDSGWNALFWALGPHFGPDGDTPER